MVKVQRMPSIVRRRGVGVRANKHASSRQKEYRSTNTAASSGRSSESKGLGIPPYATIAGATEN